MAQKETRPQMGDAVHTLVFGLTMAQPTRQPRPLVTPPGQARTQGKAVDIGEAITRSQVDEYRDASEAKAAGRESPRLVLAYWVCLIATGIGCLYFFIATLVRQR
ncbi:hypothetical protein E1218_04990 [Kribbella turkmenica]|uniref:Uncharacterized protein n=2 Tax=Kribbella turkmenica TaxID=2530375 RepID=A0A4R4XEW9_9ACTN|nr:hypothetical protein E1218_04990 [Kribbella turkmenica]